MERTQELPAFENDWTDIEEGLDWFVVEKSGSGFASTQKPRLIEQYGFWLFPPHAIVKYVGHFVGVDWKHKPYKRPTNEQPPTS